MPSEKKDKVKGLTRRTRALGSRSDLSRVLMDKPVSLKLRDWFTETYEIVHGVYRGLYRFDGDHMIAIDEVNEDNLYLRRRHFYLEDIREIVLEGDYSRPTKFFG